MKRSSELPNRVNETEIVKPLSEISLMEGERMIRNLLVPLDCSAFGEHALPWAISIAKRDNAVIHLVHINPPISQSYNYMLTGVISTHEDEIRKQSKEYLTTIRKRIIQSASLPVEIHSSSGDVCEQLTHHARSTRAEYLVMTTHGRGPLGRFWLGSIADNMIRHAPAPVLLIRPGEQPANLRNEQSAKQILVPLDGTDVAEHILKHVVPLCKLWNGKISLVDMIESYQSRLGNHALMQLLASRPVLRRELEDAEEELRVNAEKYLMGIRERLAKEDVEVASHLCIDHSTAVAILGAAETLEADMIAIETHGRGGLSRLLLGSVADKVIRGTTLPVLVHRAPSGAGE